MAMTQTEMRNRIITRAGEDDEFRARLVADPRGAIRELTGEPVPETVTVLVHEEDPTTFHLVPPPDSRLTEDEMAHVFAGDPGTSPPPSTPGYGQGPGGYHR